MLGISPIHSPNQISHPKPNPNPIIILVNQSNLVQKKSEAHLCVMRICMFFYITITNSNIITFFSLIVIVLPKILDR